MYTIQRYEKNKNHEGEIVSIFIALGVSMEIDGVEEQMTQEHWLTEEERDLVLADESNLKPILEETAAEGLVRLKQFAATRPQPTVYATQEEKETHAATIRNTEVQKKVVKKEEDVEELGK